MGSSQLRARSPQDNCRVTNTKLLTKSALLSLPSEKGIPYRPPVFTPCNKQEYPENSLSEGQRFTLFTKLPAELQLEIWKIAAAAPQIFRLNSGRKYQIPSLIIACQASQEVFLKVWPNKSNLGEKDLVVLDRTFDYSQRINEGADEIYHVAIHYDSSTNTTTHDLEQRLVRLFPRLRTWELYAEWIESLDQQRVRDKGDSSITGTDVVWIPPYKGLKLGVCSGLLFQLNGNPERATTPGVKKRLVGRPIFDVEQSANEMFRWHEVPLLLGRL
ncbi:uncharacterized protein PG998_005307 [Apiospora kogelbergensis]|uniref:uncharacterized protein n=1 Tax=Apiospora kogelbergensis TaxID=1337665 RepID=UPI00312E0272